MTAANQKIKRYYRWLKRKVFGPARHECNIYNRPAKKILVGINYAWEDYGWDFGKVPTSKRRAAWKTTIRRNLRDLSKYGIFAVRWFLLCGGENYGVDAEVPKLAHGLWTFRVPTKDPKDIVDDFEALLKEFQHASMKIVPSLIDFHWCFPGKPAGPGRVKSGRADIINVTGNHKPFFQHILDPLLDKSKTYQNNIYAWELINEPEWITKGSGVGKADTDPEKSVSMASMQAFIKEGIGRINAAGFKSTVGFAKKESLSENSVWNWKSFGITLHQFHYYPKSHENDPELEKHWFHKDYPTFIGEFATVMDLPQYEYPKGQPPKYLGPDGVGDWTWLKVDCLSQRFLDMEAKGYPSAFLWAMKPKDSNIPPNDPATDWGTTAINEVKKVTGKR